MGWNSLHAVCVQGKANEIEEEVMKKGTIVDEKSELVSACIRSDGKTAFICCRSLNGVRTRQVPYSATQGLRFFRLGHAIGNARAQGSPDVTVSMFRRPR